MAAYEQKNVQNSISSTSVITVIQTSCGKCGQHFEVAKPRLSEKAPQRSLFAFCAKLRLWKKQKAKHLQKSTVMLRLMTSDFQLRSNIKNALQISQCLHQERYRAFFIYPRHHSPIQNKKPCICRTAYMKSKMLIKNRINQKRSSRKCANLLLLSFQDNSSSPRSISIVQLNTLLCLHLRPIKLVVYK